MHINSIICPWETDILSFLLGLLNLFVDSYTNKNSKRNQNVLAGTKWVSHFISNILSTCHKNRTSSLSTYIKVGNIRVKVIHSPLREYILSKATWQRLFNINLQLWHVHKSFLFLFIFVDVNRTERYGTKFSTLPCRELCCERLIPS